jgi:hypothetical protein
MAASDVVSTQQMNRNDYEMGKERQMRKLKTKIKNISEKIQIINAVTS